MRAREELARRDGEENGRHKRRSSPRELRDMSDATLTAPTPEATAAADELAADVVASTAAPAATERPAKRPRVADEAPSNPEAKRKVALLLAYNGAKFQGLQKNPGATTVEQTLEDAIHACGGISDANYEAGYQKVSWSRAGRTDKGVHAVGQLIGLKMVLHNDDADPDPMVARVNAELARGAHAVRILAVARATNGFCAHSGCSSREYEYLLPACALRPAGSAHGDGTTAPTAAELERLRGLLAQLEGTHSFHNLSDGKLTLGDKQAQRYIKGTSVGEHVRVAAAGSDAAVDGVGGAADGVGEAAYFVPVRFHGQSFLLHQIRKMVALIVAVARGDARRGGDTPPPDGGARRPRAAAGAGLRAHAAPLLVRAVRAAAARRQAVAPLRRRRRRRAGRVSERAHPTAHCSARARRRVSRVARRDRRARVGGGGAGAAGGSAVGA